MSRGKRCLKIELGSVHSTSGSGHGPAWDSPRATEGLPTAPSLLPVALPVLPTAPSLLPTGLCMSSAEPLCALYTPVCSPNNLCLLPTACVYSVQSMCTPYSHMHALYACVCSLHPTGTAASTCSHCARVCSRQPACGPSDVWCVQPRVRSVQLVCAPTARVCSLQPPVASVCSLQSVFAPHGPCVLPAPLFSL